MKKGFTLIEMLVVLGIIAVLMGAAMGGLSAMTKSAEKAKVQELVSNTATALTALFQDKGVWPRAMREKGAVGGLLDADAAYPLRNYMSLTVNEGRLAGLDRFGIVTPAATKRIKAKGSSASLSDKIGNATIEQHILHFALDLDGDGIIENVSVGGETLRKVRATAMVWFSPLDTNGNEMPYSRGLRKNGVYSWTQGQIDE